MINLLKESLREQFGAIIYMLEKAITLSPESLLALVARSSNNLPPQVNRQEVGIPGQF